MGEIGLHQYDVVSWFLNARPKAVTGFGSLIKHFGDVGIVGDVKETTLEREPNPAIYWPHARDPYQFMNFVVRTAMEQCAVVRRIAWQPRPTGRGTARRSRQTAVTS